MSLLKEIFGESRPTTIHNPDLVKSLTEEIKKSVSQGKVGDKELSEFIKAKRKNILEYANQYRNNINKDQN